MMMIVAVPVAATAYSQWCNIQDLAFSPVKATKVFGLVWCNNEMEDISF